MQDEQLDRINELARKSRVQPLTEEELLEQQQLRAQYIESYRRNMRAQLDNIVIVDQKTGIKKKITPKSKS